MEATAILLNELYACYKTKAPFVDDYLKLSETEKLSLCKEQREKAIFHLNSDQVTTHRIALEHLRHMKENQINYYD